MKFIDLFAGIGGFRTGFSKEGFEPFGYVEIDKYARRSYEAIYEPYGEWTRFNMQKVSDEAFRELKGEVDLILGGFPCQTFSVAGSRKGFEDETRGTLFFDIARAVKQIEPKLVVLENVKGLMSHDGGRTFKIVLETFDELGYIVEWEVLNSSNFGVAQNRERVFIIAHKKEEFKGIIYPLEELSITVPVPEARFGDFRYDEGLRVRRGGESPTLVASATGGGISSNVLKLDQDKNGQYGVNSDIRLLTPLEYWRLQGFSDEQFKKASRVNNEVQLYKQAGNSVTVNVIHQIAKKIREVYGN